jgi:transposase
VRRRAKGQLPEWLRAAAQSRLKELVGFARGISEDYEAVRNALTSGATDNLKGRSIG